MTAISTTKIVPYSPEDMYTLVNDVKAYPDFLSWCLNSTIHEQSEDEMKATLVMSASGFTKSITTHNRMQKNKMIEMRLIEGPLQHFESFWRFERIEGPAENPPQCHVFFDIEFEFSNRFIRMALEPFFNKIADTIVDAFSDRADALYQQ